MFEKQAKRHNFKSNESKSAVDFVQTKALFDVWIFATKIRKYSSGQTQRFKCGALEALPIFKAQCNRIIAVSHIFHIGYLLQVNTERFRKCIFNEIRLKFIT